MSTLEKPAKPVVRVGLPPDLLVPNLRIDTPTRSYAENKQIAKKLCKDNPGLVTKVIEMDVIKNILKVGWNEFDFNHWIKKHNARLGLEVQEPQSSASLMETGQARTSWPKRFRLIESTRSIISSTAKTSLMRFYYFWLANNC